MARLDVNYLGVIRGSLFNSSQNDKKKTSSSKQFKRKNEDEELPKTADKSKSKSTSRDNFREETQEGDVFLATTEKTSPSISNLNGGFAKKYKRRSIATKRNLGKSNEEVKESNCLNYDHCDYSSEAEMKKKNRKLKQKNNDEHSHQMLFNGKNKKNSGKINKMKKAHSQNYLSLNFFTNEGSKVSNPRSKRLKLGSLNTDNFCEETSKGNVFLATTEKTIPSVINSNEQFEKKFKKNSFSDSKITEKKSKVVSLSGEFLVDFASNNVYTQQTKSKNENKQLKKRETTSKRTHKNKSSIQNKPKEAVLSLEDFYDDESISVKGLKFDRISDLFEVIPSEHIQEPFNTLQIPKKHFKTTEDENVGKLEDAIVLKNSNIFKTSQSPLNHLEISKDKPSLDITITQENEGIKEKPACEVLQLKDGSIIVVLEEPSQIIYFNGLCNIKVLSGKVDIFGASLDKSCHEVNIYSPRGTSLLYVRNSYKIISQVKVENMVLLKQLVPDGLLEIEQERMFFPQESAIILCKQIKQPYIEFIESHISQKIFPDADKAVGPRVDFHLLGRFNKIKDDCEWEDVVDGITETSKIAICGGKGVGKSTFLRYAINSLLGRYKTIRVVDLDPGQSEFCSPGCISVNLVNTFVFGPNYTHLQTPECSILSHINMSYNIKHYIESVNYLSDQLKLMEPLVTLINFPGFTQGLGLDVSIAAIKILQPNTVLEIKSKRPGKNYKIDLTAENVNRETNKLFGVEENEEESNYEYIQLKGFSESNGAWSLEARQAREMCILSYFGNMMFEGARELTSPNIAMFNIRLSALEVVNLEGNSLSPLAINGNIVALCSVTYRKSDILLCYGFGFVRGIDVDGDLLILLTPEPITRLDKVTHIVLSSVNTPPSLLMSCNDVEGQIPYLNIGDVVDLGQFTKRSYLPPNK
ncbi:polynucleotide 5'-hydroxyl-kinase NOL9 [Euwallacea similis]|uniref:polynucleotide 5'-hydroxyl-kinase NOL9 n=1 Tax=Euwallacea similis TaxID=1736056 RepID=UPI00344D9480